MRSTVRRFFLLFYFIFFKCRTWTVSDECMWPELCTAPHSRASSFFFILFSRGRYVSLVLWLWLSRPIWDDSFLHLKHTRSDQMCDWSGINLCWERFSPPLCWELFTVWYNSPGGNFFFFFLSFSFFFPPPFQAQSKRSIRSCDLKFPSFKVSGARRGWLGAVEGTIRYNFALSCTFSSSERGNKPLPEYDYIPQVSSSLSSLSLSLREGTIKYAQVCAA